MDHVVKENLKILWILLSSFWKIIVMKFLRAVSQLQRKSRVNRNAYKNDPPWNINRFFKFTSGHCLLRSVLLCWTLDKDICNRQHLLMGKEKRRSTSKQKRSSRLSVLDRIDELTSKESELRDASDIDVRRRESIAEFQLANIET